MATKKFGVVSVLTVVVGVVGVLGPIGWDYYKTTISLELRASKTSEIIAEASKLAGLSILYNGEVVPSLSKTTFTLVNAGRTPILEKDVVSPVTIKFPEESGVIEAKIEAAIPKDIGATISFEKAAGTAVVRFPLMNPGDAIRVSVLSKASNIKFSYGARVAGINSIPLIQEVEEPIEKGKSRWITIPVGMFSVLMILAAFVGLSQARTEVKIKRQLRNGTYQIPAISTKAACLAWVDREFFFTTAAEHRALKALISTLDEVPNFSEINNQKIMTGVTVMIETAQPNMRMAAIVSLIAALGIYYIF